jgi:hypothetical protein
MPAPIFDGMTEQLDESATRRSVFRLLGGVMAVAGGMALGGSQAAAKNKGGRRKCRIKCGSGSRLVGCRCRPTGAVRTVQAVCQPGKAIATISVPATGPAVTTPVLATGQTYRLQVSGFWAFDAEWGNDAAAAFRFTDQSKTATSFEGTRMGLSLNGGSPDEWGNYNQGHVYERQIVGQGTALSLRYTYPSTFPSASYISGALTVTIFCT